MNKKQPENTEKTRNIYMEAFCALYKKKPIEKISIQELTNKAGYNRSTFYQYFRDIYDFRDYLENYALEQFQKYTAEINYDDDFELLLLNLLVRYYEEHYVFCSALLGKYGIDHFASKIKKNAIPKILEKFKIPNNNFAPRFVLEFHLSGIVAAVAYWYRNKKNIPTDEIKKMLHGIYFEGSLRYFLKTQSE